MNFGKKIWIFADGDLPPQGVEEPLGHEALMVVNNGKEEANIKLKILFDDKDPVSNIYYMVPAQRVKCIRMDYPIGDINFQIPFGQYAVILESDQPVVCLYGRLDRRPDISYYPIGAYYE